MDCTVRRHKETGQNKTKSSNKSRGQFHQSHQLAWQKFDCSKHHCTTEPMLWKKKASTSTVKIFWESGIYGKIAVKKPLLRNQNNVKRLQCVKAHKDWTIQQCNKVLWTDESKFEIFGSHRSVYVRRRVGERAATPCIPPTVKHRKSSVIVWGGYCQLQSRSFAPGEG